jgi:hypothetical protein
MYHEIDELDSSTFGLKTTIITPIRNYTYRTGRGKILQMQQGCCNYDDIVKLSYLLLMFSDYLSVDYERLTDSR